MPRWKDYYNLKNKRYFAKKAKIPHFTRLAKFFLIFALLSFFSLFLIFPLLAINLPSPDKVVRKEGFTSKIVDRNGEVIYGIYGQVNRIPVTLDQVPKHLQYATIAIEDKNFYKHQGFDVRGVLRAIFNILFRGKIQGGSTLTQQLVKNVLLSSERTITRKIKEFVLALQIERKYTKDQILQMYLNEAPYGGTAWGVGAASQMYFGKDVSDLNLVESAFLAGLPQRPSFYSPYSSTPNAYKDRTRHVLRRMREDGYITKEEEEKAVLAIDNLHFQEKTKMLKAAHFVSYVQKLLIDKYGEDVIERGGLEIRTTLDLKLQEEAEKIVKEEIDKVKDLNVTNGAVIVLNPDNGEILAMVGSKDFFDQSIDGQFNVATQGLRQPGSAIKPIVYVTAFRKGYTPATMLMDVNTEFYVDQNQPLYRPVNYDGKFRGPIQIRYALGNSINIPAVKMIAYVGIRSVLEMAYELGISTLSPTQDTLKKVGLSLALGGGEVRLIDITAAYSAFTNGGYRVEPSAILEVKDSKGKIIEKKEPKKLKKVLSEGEAFLIFDILSDNDARKDVFGPNSLLNIPGRKIAVKTGTTNDKRDNWAIGGDQQVMVGVWVGNSDYSPMKKIASGVSGATPIWRRVLLKSLEGKEKVDISPPAGVVRVDVDLVSGYQAHDGFPSRSEYFLENTLPGVDDPIHLKLKVCKTDGNLATPDDISSGNYEEKEFFVLRERDPVSKDGKNRFQEGIDKWLLSQSDLRYHPPTDYCRSSSPVSVDFINPMDKDSNLSNEVMVKINADSIYEIAEVALYIDGKLERTFSQRPYEGVFNLSTGTHTLKAKATDKSGNSKEKEIIIGVNVFWDYLPSPLPTSTPSPSPLPTL